MFNSRTTSQKPDETLLCSFRSRFQEAVRATDLAGAAGIPGGVNNTHIQPDATAAQPAPQFAPVGGFMYGPTSDIWPQLHSTPRTNQMCTVLHSPAGDLHTPRAEMIPELDLSAWDQTNRAHSEPLCEPPVASSSGGDSQYVNQLFHNMNPFASTGPSSLAQTSSYYDSESESLSTRDHKGSLYENILFEPSYCTQSPQTNNMEPAFGTPVALGSRFRFNVTLHTATAMIRPSDPCPVTYLNKAQTYSISITDLDAPYNGSMGSEYRSYIGIFFDEPAQRSDPQGCWQMWRNGRGLEGAKARDGSPLAVEFIGMQCGSSNRGESVEDLNYEREQTSFDGFSVRWTGGVGPGNAQCVLQVKFHFLSTDFSHSKGIKGDFVRLCAKTEMISPDLPGLGTGNTPEICYCKVKVFRDHGAERRVSNDVQAVKKAIRTIEEQIARPGTRNKGIQKRRKSIQDPAERRKSIVDLVPQIQFEQPSMVPGQIRAIGPLAGPSGDAPVDDTLQQSLLELKGLFSTPQAVSMFLMRGEGQDDPDERPPVSFSSESSGSGSSVSLASGAGSSASNSISRTQSASSLPSLSVACFFIRFLSGEEEDQFHKALYLRQRTVRELAVRISEKQDIPIERIIRLVHINRNNIHILVDDDVVQEIPEGQDMMGHLMEIPAGAQGQLDARGPTNYEIRLVF